MPNNDFILKVFEISKWNFNSLIILEFWQKSCNGKVLQHFVLILNNFKYFKHILHGRDNVLLK